MGRTGVTKSCSSVPRSFSRTIENAAERFVEADGGGHVDGMAGDRGVRAVDEDEDLGAHVVEKAVRIIHGNLDSDAGLSGNDGVVEIAVVLDVTDEMKGVGVFQAVDQLAAFAAAVGIQDDGIDLADVGVNAETKHNHLQQRNDEREKKSRGVAADMQDLFVKDSAETAKEVTHGRPPGALDACK